MQFVARMCLISICVLVLSSCAAGLAELGAGAELAAGAEVAAEASLLESGAIAGRTFTGLAVGAEAASAEVASSLFASDELAASAGFRNALTEIAGRTGLRLVRDGQGFLSVSGSRLGVAGEGFVTVARTGGGGSRVLGVLRDGRIWEVDGSLRPTRAIGTVRGLVARPVVELRAIPSASSRVVSTLRPGTSVQILRLHDGWFEIAFRNQVSAGWVPSSLISLVLTAAVVGSSHGLSADHSSVEPCTLASSGAAAGRTRTSVEFVTFNARPIQFLAQGGIRLTIDVTVHSGDGRGAALAISVPPRNGPYMTRELARLFDERGEEYVLDQSSMTNIGFQSTDWTIVRDGSSFPIVLDFGGYATASCASSFALKMKMHVAWHISPAEQRHEEVALDLSGIRP